LIDHLVTYNLQVSHHTSSQHSFKIWFDW